MILDVEVKYWPPPTVNVPLEAGSMLDSLKDAVSEAVYAITSALKSETVASNSGRISRLLFFEHARLDNSNSTNARRRKYRPCEVWPSSFGYLRPVSGSPYKHGRLEYVTWGKGRCLFLRVDDDNGKRVMCQVENAPVRIDIGCSIIHADGTTSELFLDRGRNRIIVITGECYLDTVLIVPSTNSTDRTGLQTYSFCYDFGERADGIDNFKLILTRVRKISNTNDDVGPAAALKVEAPVHRPWETSEGVTMKYHVNGVEYMLEDDEPNVVIVVDEEEHSDDSERPSRVDTPHAKRDMTPRRRPAACITRLSEQHIATASRMLLWTDARPEGHLIFVAKVARLGHVRKIWDSAFVNHVIGNGAFPLDRLHFVNWDSSANLLYQTAMTMNGHGYKFSAMPIIKSNERPGYSDIAFVFTKREEISRELHHKTFDRPLELILHIAVGKPMVVVLLGWEDCRVEEEVFCADEAESCHPTFVQLSL